MTTQRDPKYLRDPFDRYRLLGDDPDWWMILAAACDEGGRRLLEFFNSLSSTRAWIDIIIGPAIPAIVAYIPRSEVTLVQMLEAEGNDTPAEIVERCGARHFMWYGQDYHLAALHDVRATLEAAGKP